MSSSLWTQSTLAPFNDLEEGYEAMHLIPLNSTEFVMLPCVPNLTESCKYIFKYNSIKKQWNNIMEYPQHFMERMSDIRCFTFDENNEIIYVYGQELWSINLKTKQFALLCRITTYQSFESYSTQKMIQENDDIFHIFDIDGFQTRIEHNIFDKKTSKFMKMDHLKYVYDENAIFPILLFMKTKQNIIASVRNKNCMSSISTYCIKTNKYNDSTITMPKPLQKYNKGCFYGSSVMTKNEDYILLFGATNVLSQDILIYDVKCNKFVMSPIKCPVKIKPLPFHYGAKIIGNNDNDSLLTFGFIRHNSGKKEFPHDLAKWIGNWICYETVHLYVMTQHIYTSKAKIIQCWTINVDKILQLQ